MVRICRWVYSPVSDGGTVAAAEVDIVVQSIGCS
jgi:hypothetical protein